MRVYVVTYADIHYQYHDGRPDVSAFTSKRDAEIEYLGLIDPDLAQAYMAWTDGHEKDAGEYVKMAMERIKDGVYHDDECTISIENVFLRTPEGEEK